MTLYFNSYLPSWYNVSFFPMEYLSIDMFYDYENNFILFNFIFYLTKSKQIFIFVFELLASGYCVLKTNKILNTFQS